MRRSNWYLLLIIILAAVVQSCKETRSEYTPYISYSAFLRNPILAGDSIVGCKDTVNVSYDSSSSSYVLDTVNVQDTVMFMVGFGSRGNDLEAAYIVADTSALKVNCSISEDIRRVLDEKESDIGKGKLAFSSGYNFVSFPVIYVTRKQGSHKMVFTVQSDSKYSPVSYTFIQPVR